MERSADLKVRSKEPHSSERLRAAIALLSGCVRTDLVQSVASTNLTTHEAWPVRVSGEVKKPGAYETEREEFILPLISRAGGFTDKAYLKKVEIHRGTKTILVNVWKIRNGETSDVPIFRGDEIAVKAIAPL